MLYNHRTLGVQETRKGLFLWRLSKNGVLVWPRYWTESKFVMITLFRLWQTFMYNNSSIREVDPGTMSELKGMFNRCVKQEQWDWSSIYTELGLPTELRKAIKNGERGNAERVKIRLIESNLLHHLHTYQSDLTESACDPTAGWIYIIVSRREQPCIFWR